MYGEMTGWFEVRIDTALAGGAGKIHHRLFQNDDTNAVTGVGSRAKVTVPGPDSGGVASTGVVIEGYANMSSIRSRCGGIEPRYIGGQSPWMTDGWSLPMTRILRPPTDG